MIRNVYTIKHYQCVPFIKDDNTCYSFPPPIPSCSFFFSASLCVCCDTFIDFKL